MIGLVLAAGAGRRLRPYTDTLPKALVPLDDDRCLLDTTLANFAEVGLREVAVVVGYAADAVQRLVPALSERYQVSLELVHNDRALDWNNAYSLWCARSLFAQGFVLANGDTLHPASVERDLLALPEGRITLALDRVKRLGEEEMKVVLDGDARVRRITKLLDPATADGEYIGVCRVDGAAADDLAQALERTWRRDPGLYYEDGFQDDVDRDGAISTMPIGDVAWVEVDDARDLARAREIACRS